MRNKISIMATTLLLVAAGCPGDLRPPVSQGDHGTSSDGPAVYFDNGPRPDGWVGGADGSAVGGDAGGKLACNGDCHDYVLDRILLPTSSAQAKTYGLKKGGQSYNAFGELMVLIGSNVSSLNLQQDVDLSVYAGKTLMLVRLKATSITAAATARGQTWLGDTMQCCTNTSSVSTCKSQAMSKCFSGSTSLAVANASPKDMTFSGAISGGKLTLGPAKLILPLEINGLGKLNLSLIGVTLTATTSASGLTSGVLSGAVPNSEMNSKLIPGVAALVDKEYKDAATAQKTKDLLKSLLDTNKDGTITAAELKANVLLSNLLAGDVDADGDGNKDFSLGLGFNAVGCVIVGAN